MEEIVTLKEYFDARIQDLKTTIELSRASMEKRLESMNEFREQLKVQATTFLTRDVYESRHELLQQQVDSINKKIIGYEGKGSGINMSWVFIVGAISFIAVVVSLILNIVSVLHPGV